MKTKATTVTLLSFTSLPVETIYVEWQISRTDGPVPTPQEVREKIQLERLGFPGELQASLPRESGPFEKEVRKVFEECVKMKVPISETIDFVFGLDHVPIALREQMVRHRVGHKFGGTLGADLIPNLPDSSWWTQTFRAKDLGTFATDGEYLTPEWIEQNGDRPFGFADAVVVEGEPYRKPMTIAQFYHEQFRWIQAAYRRLVKAGMPLEDARNILPLGTQHRMTWKLNLSSLMHVLGNRSCWIAQLGMWEPVILGMVKELVEKVDPFFQRLVDPPCIKGDRFAACPFEKENKEYIHGRDPHLPCPLWTNLQRPSAEAAMAEAGEDKTWRYPLNSINSVACEKAVVTSSIENEEKLMAERTAKYVQLWGRNPKTGERLVLR